MVYWFYMRILNLYAGLGGNRKLWEGHEVTAVEQDYNIMLAYGAMFPEDIIAWEDAHDFLLDCYNDYDFIWSSPPCQSHGQYRYNVGVKAKGYAPLYPDLKLYEEILFLKHYFKGRWVVENVRPYYTPLIPPTAYIGRHLFWSNFDIPQPEKEFGPSNIRSKNKISDYKDLGFDITGTKIPNKRQALRNCVDPELGKYILECAKR
jgi:DNA (cytosine-5)-methyltransferase 1